MKTTILGSAMPILELTLDSGEAIVTEGGDVSWFSPGFNIETSTRFGSGGKRGLLSGLKRMLGGGNLFLSQYTAQSDGRLLALTANLPGVIKELRIDAADIYMVQSGAYMASTPDVEVSVGLQKKLGAGIFGGAGLVFQKLSGSGTAWTQIAGELREYELAQGQSFLVHPGHLAMYRADMQVTFASVKGVKNKFFGDSLFMVELHGPGRFWLQSMTVTKLAAALAPYLPDRDNDDD
jgi:uncharacterized protein (TIGR00266 family)